MNKESKKKSENKKSKPKDDIKSISKKMESKVQELEKKEGVKCYLFLHDEITKETVDDIFDDLRKKYSDCDGRLNVVVDSGGGDIDAAFNLSMLFRRFGNKELTFIVPRWAKSGATLLACGGDKIYLTPISELGPIDPQITMINPLEKRAEQFSPLHIESTLDLIREEFKKGSKDLADKLCERLQFPLTLGSFMKSIEIGEQYLIKLLSSRMLKNERKKTKNVAEKLTKGYADHVFVINYIEAKEIGLNVEELDGKKLDVIWDLYRLYKQKRKMEQKIKEKEVSELIKKLPPEILESLPKELKKLKTSKGEKNGEKWI